MKTGAMIKKILAECWTVEISIGEDCSYIFETSFNNAPRKTHLIVGEYGTFHQCVTRFYKKWKKHRDKYWGMEK